MQPHTTQHIISFTEFFFRFFISAAFVVICISRVVRIRFPSNTDVVFNGNVSEPFEPQSFVLVRLAPFLYGCKAPFTTF